MAHKPIQPLYVIIALYLLSPLLYLSLDIFYPSLPHVANFYSSTSFITEFTISAFIISIAISQPLYGFTADRIGRKPSLLMGLAIYILASYFSRQATSIEGLIICRALQGIGAGASASFPKIILRDLYKGSELAKYNALVSYPVIILAMLAPLLGGFIQDQFGFHGNLTTMLIIGIITLLGILIFLPETLNKVEHHTTQPQRIITNKVFLTGVLCSICALSCLIIYAAISTFYLQQQFHFSAASYGIVAMIMASGELAGTFIVTLYIKKCGSAKLLKLGFIGNFILAIVIATSAHNQYLYIITCFLLTTCCGLIIPNASAMVFSHFHKRIGYIGAMYSLIQLSLTSLLLWGQSFLPQNALTLSLVIFITAIVGFCSYLKLNAATSKSLT